MRFLSYICLVVSAASALAEIPAAVGDNDYSPVEMAQVQLGRMLFYDPILSGNRNISCATCHHPQFATSDGLALGVGEGGIGLGPERRVDPDNLPEQRIPRNAPALFNLGAFEFTRMFHDGRIELDPNKTGGLRTPLGADMMLGFANLLSAQTMFPVLSPDEMAGHYSENEVSRAVRQGKITGPQGAWAILSDRVAKTPGYAPLVASAFPDVAHLDFVRISDAIAAFVAFEWRSDGSPFDVHLRGAAPLGGTAAEGLLLFYGAAGCSGCHSGAFQTDHDFHAMGVAQFGPGKAARFESHARDTGRMRVTGKAKDAYAFRTPSLRNVTRTGPYGHTGSHSDLKEFVADHADPKTSLDRFDRQSVLLPQIPGVSDWAHLDSTEDQAALAAAIEVEQVQLTAQDLTALVAFLRSLEDPMALRGRLGVPEAVPSGLPVDR